MVLGNLNLFPFLKGWGYKWRTFGPRTLGNGEEIEVSRLPTMGWLLHIALLSDDLYGGVRFQYQAQDMELNELFLDAYTNYSLGALAQDPAGWSQLCVQPNPFSTQGQFLSVYSMGWQGFPVPYVPSTVVKLLLGSSSTQATAQVQVMTASIEVSDKENFIKSLRSLIGAGTIQLIDPALIAIGPAEVRVKGADEGEKLGRG